MNTSEGRVQDILTSKVPKLEKSVIFMTPQILAKTKNKQFVYKDLIAQLNWSLWVVDEAHSLDNAETLFYQAIAEVVGLFQNHVPFLLLASGTPYENNLDSIWTLLQCLNLKNKPGLDSCREVISRHLIQASKAIKKLARQNDEETLEESYQTIQKAFAYFENFRSILKMQLFRHRMDSEAVLESWDGKIPSYGVEFLSSPLKGEQADLSDMLHWNFFSNKENTKVDRHFFEFHHQLQRVLVHPDLYNLNEDQLRMNLNQKKTIEIEQWIKESSILSSLFYDQKGLKGSIKDKIPTLIFVEHIAAGSIIQVCIEKIYGIKVPFLTGQTPPTDRKIIVDEFNSPTNSDQPRITINSRDAGGVGIDYRKARKTIFIEDHYNPEVTEQAEKRGRRSGEEGHLNVYYFNCGTEAEKRLQVIKNKKTAWKKLILDTPLSTIENVEDILTQFIDALYAMQSPSKNGEKAIKQLKSEALIDKTTWSFVKKINPLDEPEIDNDEKLIKEIESLIDGGTSDDEDVLVEEIESLMQEEDLFADEINLAGQLEEKQNKENVIDLESIRSDAQIPTNFNPLSMQRAGQSPSSIVSIVSSLPKVQIPCSAKAILLPNAPILNVKKNS